jgi:hypothetical protein
MHGTCIFCELQHLMPVSHSITIFSGSAGVLVPATGHQLPFNAKLCGFDPLNKELCHGLQAMLTRGLLGLKIRSVIVNSLRGIP